MFTAHIFKILMEQQIQTHPTVISLVFAVECTNYADQYQIYFILKFCQTCMSNTCFLCFFDGQGLKTRLIAMSSASWLCGWVSYFSLSKPSVKPKRETLGRNEPSWAEPKPTPAGDSETHRN